MVVAHSLEHGTRRFVGVGAVAIAAVCRFFEDFGKEMADFVAVKFDSSETAYSRSVNDPSSAGEREHLGEGGGVHPCVVDVGDFCCFQIEAWNQPVYEG